MSTCPSRNRATDELCKRQNLLQTVLKPSPQKICGTIHVTGAGTGNDLPSQWQTEPATSGGVADPSTQPGLICGAAPGCDSSSYSLSMLDSWCYALPDKAQVSGNKDEGVQGKIWVLWWAGNSLEMSDWAALSHTQIRRNELQHKPGPDLKLIAYIHREASSLLVCTISGYPSQEKKSPLSFRWPDSKCISLGYFGYFMHPIPRFRYNAMKVSPIFASGNVQHIAVSLSTISHGMKSYPH